jgi:hypothetical protein
MQEIEAIKIRRLGGEDDPHAEVVLEIQTAHGDWLEIGRERIDSAFSHIWSLPYVSARLVVPPAEPKSTE